MADLARLIVLAPAEGGTGCVALPVAVRVAARKKVLFGDLTAKPCSELPGKWGDA